MKTHSCLLLLLINLSSGVSLAAEAPDYVRNCSQILGVTVGAERSMVKVLVGDQKNFYSIFHDIDPTGAMVAVINQARLSNEKICFYLKKAKYPRDVVWAEAGEPALMP